MANDLVQQMGGAVGRMPAQRRIVLLGGVLVVVAAVIGVGMWAAEPAWVVLYGGITLGEAGQMTDALDKAGVRNKVGTDGSEVLVSKQDYAKARVLVAKTGLPRNGRPGYELIEQQNALANDFMQRVNFQRALEGELSRSISGTAGIEVADVHLTIPEPSALRRNDRPAKAAVQLKMRPGMLLPQGAVQGIVAVVSSSVDRLSPENVVITDESGRLLSAPPEDGTTFGGASRQMETQQSVERYLAGKAARMLETVAGLGVPRVQVNAHLNFDQVERSVESFDPEGQVLSAEGRSETQASPDGAGGQTIVNNNYQNSRKYEKILSAGGGVTKLSVSVAIDERALNADSTSTTPIADRLANVEALVKNAIGFDSARGDQIAVKAIPFEVAVKDSIAAPPPRSMVDLADRFARPAVGLFAIVALMLVAFRTLKTIQTTRPAHSASGRNARGDLISPDADSHMIPPLGPTPETVLLKNRVVEETGGKPELTAQVVRAWMTEGTQA